MRLKKGSLRKSHQERCREEKHPQESAPKKVAPRNAPPRMVPHEKCPHERRPKNVPPVMKGAAEMASPIPKVVMMWRQLNSIVEHGVGWAPLIIIGGTNFGQRLCIIDQIQPARRWKATECRYPRRPRRESPTTGSSCYGTPSAKERAGQVPGGGDGGDGGASNNEPDRPKRSNCPIGRERRSFTGKPSEREWQPLSAPRCQTRRSPLIKLKE